MATASERAEGVRVDREVLAESCQMVVRRTGLVTPAPRRELDGMG